MEINILGSSTDLRTNTPVIYGQMSIADYLELIGEDFDVFAIQRRREKHKAYARMKQDIVNGALLPAITLAVKPEVVAELLQFYRSGNTAALASRLASTGNVNILDGLQRTYILKDLSSEGIQFRDGQSLLLEFWLESNYKHLIYRIIVLNAGQKPMSMRHQIEVLFSIFKPKLESEIPGLELIDERSNARRTRARKYALDRIVTSHYSFLTKSPEVEKENVVAQQLVEESVLGESEERLSTQFDQFTEFLKSYAELDDEVCRVYDGSSQEPVPTGTNWFGLENVMNAFFAAVADFGSNDEKLNRVKTAIGRLLSMLQQSQSGSDPLNLKNLLKITQSFNTRKVNVGFATRKLMSSSFKEFFRDEGERPLGEYWAAEAE